MPFGLGMGETVIILAVFLLLFGAKRLPELASGMGKGIREFKRTLTEEEAPEEPKAVAPPAATEAPADPPRTV